MTDKRWEPVEEYGSVQDEFLVDYDRIWVGAVEEYEWIVLPADLRLCRRVEPKAITAEALRREGWKDAEPDECILTKRIDDNLTCYFWHDGEGEYFEVVYAAVPYPGVKTMPQLRALVEFLQG